MRRVWGKLVRLFFTLRLNSCTVEESAIPFGEGLACILFGMGDVINSGFHPLQKVINALL